MRCCFCADVKTETRHPIRLYTRYVNKVGRPGHPILSVLHSSLRMVFSITSHQASQADHPCCTCFLLYLFADLHAAALQR